MVFTHDTHSHLNSFSTVIDGESTEVGGFARIKTVIDEQKAENPDTLVVDGGDFSMGTLVQTVYEAVSYTHLDVYKRQVEKVLVYEKNRVEIIFRFKDEFETTMNYIRTMERCGRLTPSKEADERVVV